MKKTAAILTALIALTLSACGDDDNGDDMGNTGAIPTIAAGGEQLCEFVPRESVALAVGTDDFEVHGGEVRRDSDGVLIGADCRVDVDDQVTVTVRVEQAAPGLRQDNFTSRLTSDEVNQLPNAVGLGFSWTDDEERDGGDTVSLGHSWVLYGDYFVTVDVSGLVEGRDPEADAVAVAQQVRDTLQISDEWTMPGDQPTR